MSKSLFISRALTAHDPLRTELEAQGWEITAMSLIQIIPTEFELPKPLPDWVFFSSSNAVKTFYRQYPDVPFKIGVTGKGTEKTVKEYEQEASFVGEGTDMNQVGKAFAEEVGDETVLFPVSSRSSKSIQNHIPESQQIVSTVYKTILRKGLQLPETDVVVLSSPSNAEAYLDDRKVPENATVIAYGETTKSYLNEQGVTDVKVPDQPNSKSILEIVQRL